MKHGDFMVDDLLSPEASGTGSTREQMEHERILANGLSQSKTSTAHEKEGQDGDTSDNEHALNQYRQYLRLVHGVLASTVTDAYCFSLVRKENIIGHEEIFERLVTGTMEKLYLLQQKHPHRPESEFTFPFPFTQRCNPDDLQTKASTIRKNFCQHYGLGSIRHNTDYDALWNVDAREMNAKELDNLQKAFAEITDISR
jgi:hypothetical protein